VDDDQPPAPPPLGAPHAAEDCAGEDSAASTDGRVLDAATRRYLLKVAARWSPLLVCTAALGLIVSLAPPVPAGNRAVAPGSTLGSVAPGTGQAGTATSSTSVQGPAATGGPGGGPGQLATAASGGTGAGSPGLTRTGVACGPGVRQFSWSAYAPMCVPAFHGNNGGTTSHGVTATTITVSYREPNSSQQAAAQSLAGSAFPDDNGLIADMQTYIKFFNSQFELYGRHVVLVPYQGQGDYLAEDEGQDLAAAQADAATAYDLGAFADLTFPLFGSQYYEQDLAQAKVIGIGGLGFPDQWYAQYAPYEYSVTPTGTAAASGFATAACDRMAGLPAIYAGDAAAQHTTRVFGLVTPENPEYMAVGDLVQHGMQSQCGQGIAKRASYAIDIASFEQQSVSIVAQMKQAGVTTVICGCDPLFPILLTQAADQQQYYPEWLTIGWYDPQGRLPAQDQMAHAISQEGAAIPNAQSEAYRVFEMADPNGRPAEQYFSVAYYSVLYLFDLLQAAGPDLTPATFQQAAFSMPASRLGDAGTWQGGADAYSPVTTTQIGWWDPTATSAFDGKQGAWESCEGGRWFTFLDPSTWAPIHTQFHCFGH